MLDKWRNVNGGGGGSGGRRKARTSHPPVMPEPCRISLYKRIAKYNTMIYESLKYIEDPYGTDLDTMINFLKSKYELESTFRKSFTAALRALEVNDRYKVMGTSSGAETSRQEDVRTNAVDTQEHPASVAIKVALAEINK
ncbi:single myb histone 4-like [Helianthus annuus]|uniref:single myb histone 4-like n=1 Tax=Helianthus annuus TaxID=4232 RepID=UPI000B8F1718|nr:single myb histone 4-like [Helianthus annuus]